MITLLRAMADVSRIGGRMMAAAAVADYCYPMLVDMMMMMTKGDALKTLGFSFAVSFLAKSLIFRVGPHDGRVVWNVVMAAAVLAYLMLTTGPVYRDWASGWIISWEELLANNWERYVRSMTRKLRLRRSFGRFKSGTDAAARDRMLRKGADEHIATRRKRWTFEHWAARPGGVLARAAARRFDEARSGS